MALGKEVGLGARHIVLDGDLVPAPQIGRNPPFLAHVYCSQTAGWLSTPLCTEVVIGTGHIALDGVPAAPLFGPCLLWLRSPISATAELLLIYSLQFRETYERCQKSTVSSLHA